jgi:RNA polymerase sigma-70 factor (ECF subfamily)
LTRLAREGGPLAVRALLHRHRPRLLRMVEMRLDHRLQVDETAASVLVEQALLDAEERFADYALDAKPPLFLWLRQLVAARLAETHRTQLGKEAVDISLARPTTPPASSIALAAHLLGKISTPEPGEAQAKRLRRLETALNGLEPLDRDILSLRHFEDLTHAEAAMALDLEGSEAARRYIRALKRLNEALAELGKHPRR